MTEPHRILYSNPGCPFAHRTRALLAHLQIPFELRDTSLIFKDREFMRLSPTGKVPMLVEPDGTVFFESAIIAEYLGETHDFVGWSEDPTERARQRLAVQQFDAAVLPFLYYRPIRAWPFRWLRPREARAIAGELDLLESLAETTPPRSHLGLLLAPFWIRFRLLSFLIGTESRFRERPKLAAWLDAAAALPEVQGTMGDDEAYIRRYRRMQYTGLASYGVLAVVVVGTILALVM